MAIIIFFGEKEIQIVSDASRSNWPKNEEAVYIDTRVNWDATAFLSLLHNSATKQILLGGAHEEDVLHLLMSNFTVISAAGGIVTDNQGRMLFIFRRNKWDLPKGKIEAHESILEAATREIQEETGIEKLVAHEPIITTYHFYELNGSMILKPSHWFHFSTDEPNNTKPQTEEEITDIKWFDEHSIDIPLANTYENITLVVRAFIKAS